MPIPESMLCLDYGTTPPVFKKVIEKEDSDSVVIYINKKTPKSWRTAGYIVLMRYYNVYMKAWAWETHSKVYSRFQNKGYGLYLYSLAADFANKKNTIITSSSRPSYMARRMWKSKRLKEFYNVSRVHGRWKIEPKVKYKHV